MKVWPEPSRNTAKEISTQLTASHAQAEAGRAVSRDGPLILHIVNWSQIIIMTTDRVIPLLCHSPYNGAGTTYKLSLNLES